MPFNFEKNLTEKLGPLPGYAWVILGVGGVYWYRKKHPGSSLLSTNAAAPIPTSSTPATDPNATGPANNVDWANAAAQSLYSSSAYSPTDIQNALSSYLSGASLTSAQQSIINAATAGLGNTPTDIGNVPSSIPGATLQQTPGGQYYYAPTPIDSGNFPISGLILQPGSTLLIPPDATPGYSNPPGFSGTAVGDANSGTSAGSSGAPSLPVFAPAPAGTFVGAGPSKAHAGQINTSLAGTSARGN